MQITDVRLHLPRTSSHFASDRQSGDIAQRGWVTQVRVANPMSIYPDYAAQRRSWMGPGQEHYAIEIETDTGHVGVCANYYGGPMACQIISNHFRRFLIGRNPLDSERIWEQMHRASLPYGLGGLVGMAIAGVDLALWDLKGKILGQPVYRLIGGATKPEGIPCYLTTHPDAAGQWRDSGFLGVKIAAPHGLEAGREGLLAMADIIRDLRDAVGPAKEIMVDCYMSWDIEFASRLAAMVGDCAVKWFEDPLPNGYAARANADLRRRIAPICLAVGNMEYHHKAFHQLIEAGACDIIQPELHWIGGLTPTLWIAAFARAHQIPVIPHGANVYPFHFVMANTGSPYAEFVTGGDGASLAQIFDLLLDQPLPVDGRVHLSEEPGFGVRLNHDRLRPFPQSPAT